MQSKFISLHELNIGDVIYDKDTTYNNHPIKFKVIAKDHYKPNTVTLIPENLPMYKAFDAREPLNPDPFKADHGNNDFSYSNLLMWLNSSSQDWYVESHKYDQAPEEEYVFGNPYINEPGFLANFGSEFKNSIREVEVESLIEGNIFKIPVSLFLFSAEELNIHDSSFNEEPEGKPIPYFATSNNRQFKPDPTAILDGIMNPNIYWTRTSPYHSSSSKVCINQLGDMTQMESDDGTIGVLYGLNLDSQVKVELDNMGSYRLIFRLPPEVIGEKNIGRITKDYMYKYTVVEPNDELVDIEIYLNNLLITSSYGVDPGEYTFPITMGMLKEYITDDNKFNHKITFKISNSLEPELATEHNVLFVIGDDGPRLSFTRKVIQKPLHGIFNFTYSIFDDDNNIILVQEKINGKKFREYGQQDLESKRDFNIELDIDKLKPDTMYTLTVYVEDITGLNTTGTVTFRTDKKYYETHKGNIVLYDENIEDWTVLDISPPSLDDGNIRLTSTELYEKLNLIPIKLDAVDTILQELDNKIKTMDQILNGQQTDYNISVIGTEQPGVPIFTKEFENISVLKLDNEMNIYHNGDNYITKTTPSNLDIFKYPLEEDEDIFITNMTLSKDKEYLYLVDQDNKLTKVSTRDKNKVIWKHKEYTAEKIHCLTTDLDQNLYVGFNNGELIKINHKTGDLLWSKFNHKKIKNFVAAVRSIYIDTKYVYTGGSEGRVVKTNMNDGTIVSTYEQHFNFKPILQVYVDSNDNITVLTEEGLFIIDKHDKLKLTISNRLTKYHRFIQDKDFLYIHETEYINDKETIHKICKYDLTGKIIYMLEVTSILTDMILDTDKYLYYIEDNILKKIYTLQYPYIKRNTFRI